MTVTKTVTYNIDMADTDVAFISVYQPSYQFTIAQVLD